MAYDPDAGMHLPGPDPEHDKRQRVLGALGLLTPADPEFDNLAADLAAEAGAPYAMVNIFNRQQTFIGLYAAGGDLPRVERTMDRSHGYCPEVVQRRTALVLPDVMSHPRFGGNPVVDRIGIRTYAGIPLLDEHSDTVLGTVCFVGVEQRPQSTGQQSLELVKQYRDEVMQTIYKRASLSHES